MTDTQRKTDLDLDKFIETMEDEEIEVVRTAIMAQRARVFDFGGFSAFVELLFSFKLAEHSQFAAKQTFQSFSEGRGIVIEMFRGGAKTTIFNNALACFIIGHFPEKPGLLVQVGDAIATDNSGAIAQLIEHSPGFNLVFPHVVPDKQRGWGAQGYCVKRNDVEYSTWVSMLENKDPTFVGLGYKSSSIIGKRPYWLILDDINDENNTSSEVEARRVETILKGTIFPASNMADFLVVIGTPWNENDALHYCVANGVFDHIKVPVIQDGELAWPDMFDEEEIEKQRKLAGEIEFARMFLLDLEKTKGLTLKREWLHRWPNVHIKTEWPVFIGVDFTSTEDPMKRTGDYFALAVGRVIPGKGMVLEDGVRARLSQAEAEGMVVSWCARYPTLMGVGVEAIITGQMFYNNLLDNAELKAAGVRLYPVRFKTRKGHRFEKILAPLFQRSRIFVSDANNDFLYHFENEWVNWQGDPLEDMYHNDTLDAVYSMTVAAENFVSPVSQRGVSITNPLYFEGEKKVNPFVSLGRR